MKKFIVGLLTLVICAFTVSAHDVGFTSDIDQNDQVVTVDVDHTPIATAVEADHFAFNTFKYLTNEHKVPDGTTHLAKGSVIKNNSNYLCINAPNSTHNGKSILTWCKYSIDRSDHFTYENVALQNKLLKDSRILRSANRTMLFKSDMLNVMIC